MLVIPGREVYMKYREKRKVHRISKKCLEREFRVTGHALRV